MRTRTHPRTPSVNLRDRRADYGVDAPLTGLLPPAVAGITLAALSAYHHRRGHRVLPTLELLSSLPCLFTAAVYLHATRRGKFQIWAELLEEDLHLRGDEQCLDMGCGQGAVIAMLGSGTRRSSAQTWSLPRNHKPRAERERLPDGSHALTGVLLTEWSLTEVMP